MPTQLNSDLSHRRQVKLSMRELEVLRLIARGHQSQTAADMLYISKRTVDFHLANAFEKLGVKNRMRAVVLASQLGMLHYEP